MKKVVNNLNKLPVAVSGLALGTAGIGNVLALEVHSSLRYVCAAIALIILLLVTIKKLAHPKLLWDEIAHPVLGSFIPAFDMCLMVIADVVTNFSLLGGQILWCFAIILHIGFAGSFLYHRFRDFDLNHMLPSWYVPPVGIVVACVTGSHMEMGTVSHAIFYVGFIAYIIMLPAMMYRLVFGDRIGDAQLPSFAIMGAPASLCLAGYLTAFSNPNPTLVGFLLALALMMTSLVILSMIRINHFRIAFIPIYASFTFPLAIGSTGLIKYSHFVGANTDNAKFWHLLGQAEMILAVIVIAWVLVNMTRHVMKNVILVR